MRRAVLDAVLSEHLRLERARAAELRRIVGGLAPLLVPTLAEQATFEQEIQESDAAVAGLALVARLWGVTGTSTRRVRLVNRARVLVRIRTTAAVLAIGLQEGTPGVDADPELHPAVTAVFRFAETALERFAPRTSDQEDDLPGKSVTVQRMLAYAMFAQRWGSI